MSVSCLLEKRKRTNDSAGEEGKKEWKGKGRERKGREEKGREGKEDKYGEEERKERKE